MITRITLNNYIESYLGLINNYHEQINVLNNLQEIINKQNNRSMPQPPTGCENMNEIEKELINKAYTTALSMYNTEVNLREELQDIIDLLKKINTYTSNQIEEKLKFIGQYLDSEFLNENDLVSINIILKDEKFNIQVESINGIYHRIIAKVGRSPIINNYGLKEIDLLYEAELEKSDGYDLMAMYESDIESLSKV